MDIKLIYKIYLIIGICGYIVCKESKEKKEEMIMS